MDPEQVAQLQQMRQMYGQGGGPQFAPQQPQPQQRIQAQQFQPMQMPQHSPLQGPSLGGGQQGGGGGGGGQGGGGVMEGAQKLIQAFAQGGKPGQPGQPGPQQPQQPGVASRAGPPIVGSQAEMGPFASQAGGLPPPTQGPATGPALAGPPMAAPPGPPVRPMGPAPQGPQMPLIRATDAGAGATPSLSDFFQLRRPMGL